jgi:AcrR family transcriptional regulator
MPRPRTVDDEQILAAAALAVGEIGPARLTLADVGSRIGLSPATLLQRFGSKRGLLLAVAATGVDVMPSRIRGALAEEKVLGALVDALVEFTTSVEDPAHFANHLSFLLMDLADPDFRAIGRRHVEGVVRAIEDVLTIAVARGELESQVDVPSLARLVHAIYNGALLAWGMAPVGLPGEAVRARLQDVVALAGGVRTGRGGSRSDAS